jgi:hypothetical protein
VTHLRQIMLEDYGAATTPSPPSTLTFTRLSISVALPSFARSAWPEHIRQYQAALFTRWKLARTP